MVQAQDPAERIRLSADYFEGINRELKQRGVKPIGHFSVAKYLLGRPDAEGRLGDGFFKFYNELWDENELGPKPVADPLDLLSKNRDGTPYVSFDGDAAPYGVYWGCLANPDWRRVLKAWVKRGIERGLDGFQINYFYRVDCHCRYCVRRLQGPSGVPLRSGGAAPTVRNRESGRPPVQRDRLPASSR